MIAREFFLPERRAHRPQVPACNACNNTKSLLEHYLMAVLPFGGALLRNKHGPRDGDSPA